MESYFNNPLVVGLLVLILTVISRKYLEPGLPDSKVVWNVLKKVLKILFTYGVAISGFIELYYFETIGESISLKGYIMFNILLVGLFLLNFTLDMLNVIIKKYKLK